MNKERIIWITIFLVVAIIGFYLSSATETLKISLFSGFMGLVVILFTQYSISKRNDEEAHRAKKTEIYIEFLNMMSKFIQANEEERTKNSDKIETFMMSFKTSIILWGSPKVILYYLKYEQDSKDKNTTNIKNIFLAVDNLYIAMREDIGLNNKGLKKYDLVKMYLKNPNELDDLVIQKPT